MVLSVTLPCYISFSFLMCFVISAQSYNSITLGSSLIAGDISSPWVSPSKDFAFGFQKIESGSFLLAIWFNRIPERTITWSANRDIPVPRGSKIELTASSLILTDPSGREVWRAKLLAGSSRVTLSSAAMLDTGNFVLMDRASAVLWQSFDEPTDTLLPTQTLKQGNRLIASFSSKNYSSGRFSFNLAYNGKLALYTTDFPLFNTLNTIYETFDDQGFGNLVVFDQSGSLYLADSNGGVLVDIFPDEISHEQSLYQRVILEYDGVLRHYVYSKSASRYGGWSIKSFTPDNICTAVIQQTGSGVCGFNSYCKLGDDSRPHCICPPGYAPLDPNNEMSGCYQNFPPQSCKEGSQDKNQYDFKVLQDVDWPLSDYEHYQNVPIEWCRHFCLTDCFCAVAIYRNGGDCWKKKVPLSNGKNDTSVDRIAFIKIRI
ncbi:G-type lectin S-receptor-like serine/threonine-protein kinase LECRK3 [Chenopodium quinoa]|nr:G-type lectin S-receptor-like serine/threonine-protein kinase LECRK3 [Chenopodium quinoa]